MKTLLLLLIFALQTHAELPADVPKVRWLPDPLYVEEGFRLGTILSLGQHWFWHYEGDLMLGFGSSPQIIMDPDCLDAVNADSSLTDDEKQEMRDNECKIDENPWPFSVVSNSLYERFSKIQADHMVVYYTKPVAGIVGAFETGSLPALWSGTSNFVQKIWATDPTQPIPPVYTAPEADSELGNLLSKVEGTTEGRVVKATMDHLIRKTYEITIQQGAHGTIFVRMSVDDPHVFDHIVSTMLGGHVVRLSYVKLLAPPGYFAHVIRGYQTYYRITKVEVLPDAQP